jgi:hypothetical protein
MYRLTVARQNLEETNNLMVYSPNNESKPHATHIMKLNPTEPVRIKRPEGDTKIPDPENIEQTYLYSNSYRITKPKFGDSVTVMIPCNRAG